jgi:hypothetical protein
MVQMGPPPQLIATTQVMNPGTINVCWEARMGQGVVQDLEYELYSDNGHNRPNEEPSYWITGTKHRCHEVKLSGDKARYTFKVVATNACGASSALVS